MPTPGSSLSQASNAAIEQAKNAQLDADTKVSGIPWSAVSGLVMEHRDNLEASHFFESVNQADQILLKRLVEFERQKFIEDDGIPTVPAQGAGTKGTKESRPSITSEASELLGQFMKKASKENEAVHA